MGQETTRTARRRSKKKKKTTPDKIEKVLLDHEEVFADLINVLIYGGDREVDPSTLCDGPTAAMLKQAEGYITQKDRDVAKYDRKNGMRYTILYGLENQTKVNFVMPVRTMGYDCSAYDKSVKDLKAENKANGITVDFAQEILAGQTICPAITLVLYFGFEHWNGPTRLSDMFDMSEIPEKARPFLQDYGINLVEVAFLDTDTIAKFTSDFQSIAAFFRNERIRYEQRKQKETGESGIFHEIDMEDESYYNKTWEYPEDILEFFRVFTNDARYENIKQEYIETIKKGEKCMMTMQSALDRYYDSGMAEGEAKGIAKGIAEGIAKGIAKGITKGTKKGRFESIILLMHTMSLSEEKAKEALCFPAEDTAAFAEWKQENTEWINSVMKNK